MGTDCRYSVGLMTRIELLAASTLQAWLQRHPGWTLRPRASGDHEALVRSFPTADFASGLALVMRVGVIAERRNHHPDIALSWGKVEVAWTTHDAGGISALDVELAELTELAVREPLSQG